MNHRRLINLFWVMIVNVDQNRCSSTLSLDHNNKNHNNNNNNHYKYPQHHHHHHHQRKRLDHQDRKHFNNNNNNNSNKNIDNQECLREENIRKKNDDDEDEDDADHDDDNDDVDDDDDNEEQNGQLNKFNDDQKMDHHLERERNSHHFHSHQREPHSHLNRHPHHHHHHYHHRQQYQNEFNYYNDDDDVRRDEISFHKNKFRRKLFSHCSYPYLRFDCHYCCEILTNKTYDHNDCLHLADDHNCHHRSCDLVSSTHPSPRTSWVRIVSDCMIKNSIKYLDFFERNEIESKVMNHSTKSSRKNSLSSILVFWIFVENFLIQNFFFTEAIASNPYISGIKLSTNQIEDQAFFGEIKTVIGSRAELPCKLSLPSPDDAIQLIFWYRSNNTRVPIYTVDNRLSSSTTPSSVLSSPSSPSSSSSLSFSLTNATHFLSDIFAPNRAYFDLESRPSVLRIDPVIESDHNDYRCRVDFRWGRTISSFVSLHVIVPPKTITIRDQNGDFVQNSTIGPYDQNSSVVLNCESNGGVPPPTLQWYKNGIMIDGSYVVGKNGQVSNELIIYKLSPQDLYDRYVCQAGNFNSSSSNPIEAFVILDINLLPIDVRILPPNKNRLIAGRKYDFRCETYGSKPTATIRWYRDGKLLTHSTETYESNKTTSLLTLSPTVEDNGLQLECRAYNPKLNSSTPISMPSSLNETDEIKTNVPQYLAADLKLQISFPPQIFLKIFIVDDRSTIWSRNYSHSKNQSFLIGFDRTKYNQNQFGINQDQDRIEIEENSTIIVQCTIKANPSLINLQIQHNGSVIHNDHNLDVNEKNVTEIRIDSIRKEHHGRYQCLASNQQGLSRSKSAFLNVLYLPRCHYRYRFLNDSVGYYHFDRALDSYSNRYALALNESIRLKCHLDSNPKPIKYFWSFDKDRHLGYRFDSKETLFAEASGELLYTIKSSKNYGRIFCWAKNLLGEQRTDFCWFQIIKAGPPDPFQRCQVTNKTTVSLTVECFPGNDGGSRPTFYAQIYEFVGAGDSDGDDEENLSDFTDFDENDRDVEFGRDTFVDRINGFNQSIDDDEDDHRDSDEDLNNFQHNRNTNQQLKTDHIYSVRLDDSNNNDDADEIKNLGIGIERKSKPIQSLSGRKSSSKHKSSASTISLLRNLSSESSPIFFLNHLTPGTFYLIELYAKNSRGKSPISRLKIATLFTKNTKLISSSLHDHEYDSWFSFLIAFLLIIVMVVVAIHIVCRVRNRRIRKAKNRRQQEQIKKNFASPPPETENETRLYNTRDLKQRQQQQQQQQQNQQKETILGEDRDPNILVVIDEKQLMRELLLQQQQQQQRQQNDSDADANISATSATSMATAMLPLNHQQPNISSTINSKDDSSISSSIKHHPNDIISFDSQTSELNSKLSFLVIKEDLTSSSSSSNVMPLMKNLINNTPTLSNDDNFLHNGSFLDNASPSLIGYHHQHQQPSQTMQPNQSQQHSSLIVSSSSPDPLSSSSNSTVPSNYHGFPRPNSNLIHHQSIQFDATNGPVLIDTTSNQQQQHHRLMAYETAATMSPIDPLPDTVSVATLYENSHNKTGSTFFENQSIPTATNLQQNLTILTPLSKHTLSANYGATNHCSQTEQSKFKTSNYHLIDSVQKPIDELDQDQSSTPTATIFYASNLSPHQILSLNDESNTILLSSSNNGFYYAQQQQQQQQQFNPSHHHRSMIETIGGDPNDSIAAIPFQLSATINDDTAIIDHDSIVNATNRSKRVEILNEENFQRNFNQNYTQKRPQQQKQQKQQSQKSSVWQSSTATIKTLDDEGCDTIGTGGGGEIYTDLQQTAV